MSDPEMFSPSRTVPEQVEFAYLTLLGHLEHLSARFQELKEGAGDIDPEDIDSLHEQVNRMLSKNFRLRHKVNSLKNPR